MLQLTMHRIDEGSLDKGRLPEPSHAALLSRNHDDKPLILTAHTTQLTCVLSRRPAAISKLKCTAQTRAAWLRAACPSMPSLTVSAKITSHLQEEFMLLLAEVTSF